MENFIFCAVVVFQGSEIIYLVVNVNARQCQK